MSGTKNVFTACFAVGSALAIVSVALAIALLVIQLRANTTTSFQTRDMSKLDKEIIEKLRKRLDISEDLTQSKDPHPMAPPISICIVEHNIIPETFLCNIFDKGRVLITTKEQVIPPEDLDNVRVPCWKDLALVKGKDWNVVPYKYDVDIFGEGTATTQNEPVSGTCLLLKQGALPRKDGGALSEITFQISTINNAAEVYFANLGAQFHVRVWPLDMDLEEIATIVALNGEDLSDGSYREVPAGVPLLYHTRFTQDPNPCPNPSAVGPGTPWTWGQTLQEKEYCMKTTSGSVRGGSTTQIYLNEITRKKLAEPDDYRYEYEIGQVLGPFPLWNRNVDPITGQAWNRAPADLSNTAVFQFFWNGPPEYSQEKVILTPLGMAAILVGSVATATLGIADLIEILTGVAEQNAVR